MSFYDNNHTLILALNFGKHYFNLLLPMQQTWPLPGTLRHGAH